MDIFYKITEANIKMISDRDSGSEITDDTTEEFYEIIEKAKKVQINYKKLKDENKKLKVNYLNDNFRLKF